MTADMEVGAPEQDAPTELAAAKALNPTPSMPDRGAAALHLALLGADVIRLHGLQEDGTSCTCCRGAACPERTRGKHPTDDRWASAERIPDAELPGLWSGWRGRHNVGVRTGHRSGFWVLDVDRAEALDELEAEIGPLPRTHTTRTGSGGLHLRFLMPEWDLGCSSGDLPKGLDVRGNGGQVVSPPSVTAMGEYEVLDDAPVAEAPTALLDRLRRKPRSADEPRPPCTGKPAAELHPYAAKVVADELARLDALGASPWQPGAGWDSTTFAVAANLLELANSPWSGYTLQQAHADLRAHAPRDDTWGPEQHEAKWQAAVAKVGDAGRPEPTGLSAVTFMARPPGSPRELGAEPGAAEDEDTAKPDRVHRGQVRMAYRLADRYAGRLMFVAKIGWHVWDGKRWALDEKGAATRCVMATLRKALADSLGDSDLREDVRKCESAGAIRGVLDIAATLEPFAVAPDDLDADPYLLNVANGTLDLRTLALRPHDPADRITKVTRAAYRPGEADGAQWDAFLQQVLPDAEVRAFLQRLAGVALLGKVVEHVLAMLVGTGANGKGVTYGALLHALGDYAAPAEPDLFTAREGAHPVGQMDLLGRRLVIVSELDERRRLAEATMKRLTGGDVIKARHMRQAFVEFRPSHTALLVTNHLPKVSGSDDAIWRRVRVVPFDVVIPEDERDARLGERLELEADAVLAWAVAGYADYAARGGLAEPDSVRVATAAYRTDSDAVARFLQECCYLNPNVRATTLDLFHRWTSWAVQDGAESMSAKAFGQALDRHGFTSLPPSNGKRWRLGLELVKDDEDDDRSPFR